MCEPSVFSIENLAQLPRQTTHWDGVRNYQARNFLRDSIKKGDEAFFYHSNAVPPGIVGTIKISQDGYADPSQFDSDSPYFDPTSKIETPRWFCVDVTLERKCSTILSLEELKRFKELSSMVLLQKGSRLSVQPVTTKEWNFIIDLIKRREADIPI